MSSGARRLRRREEGDSEEEEEVEVFSRQSDAGVSSRDLSPADMVREYWSDCKDEMVEDMERIYERMSSAADRGVDMARRTALVGVEIVKRRTRDGVDIVKRTAKEGVLIAKTV